MVSPSSRRRAAKCVVEEVLGNAAQACRALGLATTWDRLRGRALSSSGASVALYLNRRLLHLIRGLISPLIS
jgi:hypothetical protein